MSQTVGDDAYQGHGGEGGDYSPDRTSFRGPRDRGSGSGPPAAPRKRAPRTLEFQLSARQRHEPQGPLPSVTRRLDDRSLFTCFPSSGTREQLLNCVAGVSDAVLRQHPPGDLPRPARVP